MNINEKKLSVGDNLRLRILQLKPKLPRNYTTFYAHYYPDANNSSEKWRVRQVVNGKSIDEKIIERLEKLIDLIKVK